VIFNKDTKFLRGKSINEEINIEIKGIANSNIFPKANYTFKILEDGSK